MSKIIIVSFDGGWVLSKREEEKLPVDRFIESIKSVLSVEVSDKSLVDCGILYDDDKSDEELSKIVSDVLEVCFEKEEISKYIDFKINEYVVEEHESDLIFDDEILEEPTVVNVKKDVVYNEIRSLVGVEEFKALCDECVNVAPNLIKHSLVDTFTHQCYLFSINDGHGLTTYLKLFGKLLKEIGLVDINDKAPATEVKLLPQNSRDIGNDPFGPAKSLFTGGLSSIKSIISIDISEWMTKINDKSFKDFLSFIDDHLGDSIVVFRVPFVEKEILDRLKMGIGDILCIRDVSFVPFDNYELMKCADVTLQQRGFVMDLDAWDVFKTRIAEEKNDGRFYGINTVNKVIREMLYRKMLINSKNQVDDTLIKKEDIIGLAATYALSEKSASDQLNEFIGMQTVKNRIFEIVAQIEMALKDKSVDTPCIHMRFVGNPGTGKTTVARIIGKILKERGILRNGSFFEYSGRDLCGRYVGETAPKTAGICRDAYGSVLFIDEAYSLYRGKGTSTVDYGREAIDTLIAEMENHRHDLVVIMAGYTDEMNDLMDANSGLASRMPYVIEFPNYTREELYDIFMYMVKKSFSYDAGFESAAKDYFLSLPDDVIESKEFSNARFVRNLFERTWGKAILRIQMNKEDSSVLKTEDFVLASGEKEFKIIMQKKNSTLGFF